MRGHGAGFLAAFVLAIGVLLPASAADAAPAVSFTATLNGRSTSGISSNDPLVLKPGKPLAVAMTVTNNSGRPVTIADVQVQGRVMGLSFFSFDSQINLKVAAGAHETTRFDIGLVGLSDQAVGLLPTTISLVDEKSNSLASKDFSVDVKGNVSSIYGIFGIAIIAITALWLFSLIYRVATRSLPANRWSRAVQFSAAGFGVGFVLTFGVSTLRLLTPSAGVWAPFVFGAGAVGLAIGYLTPGPRVVDEDEEDQFIAERQTHFAGVGGGAHASQWPVGAGSEAAQLGNGEAQEPTRDPGQLPAGEARALPRPPAPGPHERGDTTVRANREDLDSLFGSDYGSQDPEQ